MSRAPSTRTLVERLRCAHPTIVPFGDGGFGRCTACGEDGFPLTPEAAGALPCCGLYGEHAPACDGVVRQPWALRRDAVYELERALEERLGERARAHVERALKLLRTMEV